MFWVFILDMKAQPCRFHANNHIYKIINVNNMCVWTSETILQIIFPPESPLYTLQGAFKMWSLNHGSKDGIKGML